MKSSHRLLFGVCVIVSGWAMLPSGRIPAADFSPAVAERKSSETNPLVIRRYGSSAFRKSATQLAYSPDGRWLAVADGRNVVLFDAKTGQAGLTCQTNSSPIAGFTFSPDGTKIAANVSGGLSIWDIQKGSESERIKRKEKTSPVQGRFPVQSGFAVHPRFTVHSPDRQWRVSQTSAGELAIGRWNEVDAVKSLPFKDHFPALAIANEKKWVATAGIQSNVVQIWNGPDFDSPVEWKGFKTLVRCLAASPDGELLYAGVGDRMVHVWNIKEGRETLQFPLEARSWPVSMAASPDGNLLAVSSSNNATAYETATGRLVHKVEWTERSGLVSLAFHPDGKTLAIGSQVRAIEIWDVKTGTPVHHPGPAMDKVFATEDSRLFGSYDETTVRLWNRMTGELAESFPLHPWPNVQGARPGETLFDGTEQLIVKVGGELLYRDLALGQKAFERLGQLPADGVMSGFNGRAVKVYFLGPGAFWVKAVSLLPGNRLPLLFSILEGSPSQYLHMQLSDEGQVLAGAFADNSVFIWDIATGKERHRFHLEQTPRRLFLNATGDRLAISHEDSISVWDLNAGKQIHQFQTPKAKSHIVAFGSKDTRLAVGAPKGQVRLWSLETGKEILALPAPDSSPQSMAFSPEGKQLAVGYQDKTIGVFDLGTKEEKQVFVGHSQPVSHLKFHPDGMRLVSASQAPEVFVWNLTTGKKTSSKDILRGEIQQLSWVMEGKELMVVFKDDYFFRYPADQAFPVSQAAIGSQPMTSRDFAYCHQSECVAVGFSLGVRILDRNTGRELPFLREEQVKHVAWSGNGRVLMVASNDLIGWDIDRQQQIYRIPKSKLDGSITAMVSSPDGRIVAAGHSPNAIRLWDPKTGNLIRDIRPPRQAMIQDLQFSSDGRLLFAFTGYEYFVIEVESGLVWFEKDATGSGSLSGDASFALMGLGTLLTGEKVGNARLWSWVPALKSSKRQPADQLWRAMLPNDGPSVCQSMFALAKGEDETVKFLAERLSIESIPVERVISLIKELENDSPAIRRKASDELRELGPRARSHLEAALRSEDISPRFRARLQLLLTAQKAEATPELLAVRAVQLLEWIDTPKARALIQKWANKPDEPLRREAQAALRRLSPSTSRPVK